MQILCLNDIIEQNYTNTKILRIGTTMLYFTYLLELLPVGLAIAAAIRCSQQYLRDRRKRSKRILFIATLASLLLIVAQTSWFVTYTVNGDLLGTWLANGIWTIFNILTMLVFNMLAAGTRTNVEKPTTPRFSDN